MYDSNKFNGIINVGFGSDISIKELSKLVSSIIGYEGDIIWDKSKPDGTPRKLLDISKLKRIGWSPNTKLEEGIKLTFQSYIKEIKDTSLRI